MDENYIDKKLKGILESPPEFQPDESALTDMKRRLAEIQNSKQRRPILPLLWPLLFLPLLIGGLFFYKKYEKLEQAYIALNNQITENQIHTRDSIFEKQVIYKFDTIYDVIYRVKYITEEREDEGSYHNRNLRSSMFSSRPLGFSNGFVSQRHYDWSLGDSRSSLFAKLPSSSFFEEPALLNKELRDPMASPVYLDQLLLETITFSILNPENKSGILANLDDQILHTPEYKIDPKYFFIPAGFKIGLKYSPIIIPINDYNSTAKSLGVFGTIQFPRNQRLQIGAELLNIKFEVNEPSLFSNFPIVDPTDPTDVLHELKATLSYLQIPITLQQSFRRGKKFQPMVTAGLVAYRPIKYKFLYEYITGSDEYKLSYTQKNGSFSADNLRLGLGSEYTFWNKLAASIEVQYQHGFSKTAHEYFPLRYWGLNIGLDYRFQ